MFTYFSYASKLIWFQIKRHKMKVLVIKDVFFWCSIFLILFLTTSPPFSSPKWLLFFQQLTPGDKI